MEQDGPLVALDQVKLPDRARRPAAAWLEAESANPLVWERSQCAMETAERAAERERMIQMIETVLKWLQWQAPLTEEVKWVIRKKTYWQDEGGVPARSPEDRTPRP